MLLLGERDCRVTNVYTYMLHKNRSIVRERTQYIFVIQIFSYYNCKFVSYTPITFSRNCFNFDNLQPRHTSTHYHFHSSHLDKPSTIRHLKATITPPLSQQQIHQLDHSILRNATASSSRSPRPPSSSQDYPIPIASVRGGVPRQTGVRAAAHVRRSLVQATLPRVQYTRGIVPPPSPPPLLLRVCTPRARARADDVFFATTMMVMMTRVAAVWERDVRSTLECMWSGGRRVV